MEALPSVLGRYQQSSFRWPGFPHWLQVTSVDLPLHLPLPPLPNLPLPFSALTSIGDAVLLTTCCARRMLRTSARKPTHNAKR